MSFFTSRNNMRSAQPNRRLVPPPPMRRPIPRPQMSRPIQPVRPPTGLPNQIQQPTGLPNQIQPPLGLPNVNQQPTGLPPTQTQMPTPPAVPVEQSNSMFAPPQQAMPIQQPAIAPVFQPPPQMAQPDKTEYVDFDGNPANPFSQIPMMTREQYNAQQAQPVDSPNISGKLTPGQLLGGSSTSEKYRPQEQVAGPIAPNQYVPGSLAGQPQQLFKDFDPAAEEYNQNWLRDNGISLGFSKMGR